VVVPGVDAVIFSAECPALRCPFSEDLKGALGYDPQDRLQPLLLHKTVFPPSPFPPNLAFVGMYRGSRTLGAMEASKQVGSCLGILPLLSLRPPRLPCAKALSPRT